MRERRKAQESSSLDSVSALPSEFQAATTEVVSEPRERALEKIPGKTSYIRAMCMNCFVSSCASPAILPQRVEFMCALSRW